MAPGETGKVMTNSVKGVLQRALENTVGDIEGLTRMLDVHERDVANYKLRISLLTKQKEDIEAALASE